MLNALSVMLHGAKPDRVQRAVDSMGRQGFLPASHFEWDGGALSAWVHPTQQAGENFEVRTQSGTACCVGPVWYRGKFGSAALGLLLDDIASTGRTDEMELRGNFALFLRTRDRCLLMNDALGLVRLYASPDGLLYSTSWLATCAYAGQVELDEAAAIEYVLLGASHSNQTVACGVATLPLGHTFDLAGRRTQPRLPASIWKSDRIPASFDAAVDEISDHLQSVCGEVAVAFPGHVRAALSGGFDSRLIVAGLLACGSRPELFVYGDSTSEDIPIARNVADSAGIALSIVDKNELNRRAPPPDLERLVDGALFFDGLPNDGIYDQGADQQTRRQQNAEDRIALNGGGGEIFRNFFHLPDRTLHVVDIVRSFYRGFDPKVFRRPDALAAYEDGLVSSIRQTLGIENVVAGQRLRREQVELLYPLFRCHYWMGVNNSVGVRHGHYATPLVDLKSVSLAGSLPLAWKNAGRLESRLIARLHPGIASQPSTYGFRFSDGPGWRARFKEWTTCKRPVSMRPYINAARRRSHGLRVAPGMIAHCRSMLPGAWRLDPVLDFTCLPDNLAFARVLAVEVAWRKLLA